MGLLLGYEIPLESGHLVLVKRRSVGAAPQIPHEILGIGLELHVLLLIISRPGHLVHHIEQGLPLIRLAQYHKFLERAVRVQGHGGVEQQVGVPHQIQRALRVETADMLVQLGVVGKVAQQFGHHALLLGCQPVRMLPVYGGEIHILHGIVLVPNPDCTVLEVYLVQQVAVRHTELPAAVYHISFQLELYDGHRLVHPGYESQRLVIIL